jgi:dihydrofolate reductase
MSLDGYIAKPNDDLSFLSIVNKENEDYGYNNFIGSIDTVILGRRTYDWVMSQVPNFPHADKETYVLTRTSKPADGKLHFYSGELKSLITTLKGRQGKNIFIDGGAEVVNELLADCLIDEFILSVIPILTGDGIRLFREGRPEQLLDLIDVKQFELSLIHI